MSLLIIGVIALVFVAFYLFVQVVVSAIAHILGFPSSILLCVITFVISLIAYMKIGQWFFTRKASSRLGKSQVPR